MSEPPIKRRRGCLFYGCLTGCVLLLFVLLGLLAGLHHLRKMINEATDSQPLELPATEYSAAQLKELDERTAAFQKAIAEGRATGPLTLTADDLNALLATKPGAQSLRGKLHLAIERDQLKTQVSFPMGDLGLPLLKGRYLNGTASLSVSLRDGKLSVIAHDITSKGNPLPPKYEAALGQQNLAANLQLDQQSAAVMARIQSLEIKDGKVLIVPKAPPAAEAGHGN